MRDYLRREKQRITREPQGGRAFWFVLFAGCFTLFASVCIFVLSPGDQLQRPFTLGQAGAGVGLILTAIAELLSKEKRRFAVTLRTWGLVALASGAALGVAGLTVLFSA